MKKLSMLAAAVVLALLSAPPLWAWMCPEVIKEGWDTLAKKDGWFYFHAHGLSFV